jgi:hypothetical protein
MALKPVFPRTGEDLKREADRNLAIERVGFSLYGELWIGRLSDQEWLEERAVSDDAGKFVGLPADAASARSAARACFRTWGARQQIGQVLRWLEEQGIVCDPSQFNAAAFESWFQGAFPSARLLPKAARLAAMRRVLATGRRPGRGGNVREKQFCDSVRKEWGGHCTDRTIMREWRALNKSDI